MSGVRISIRRSEGIHHPGQAAVIADDNVRILIESKERREGGDAIANIAVDKQAALRVDVVAEGDLGDVAAVERNQRAAQKAAQFDAARALVRGAVVVLP